jgi:REP element-mobilizing transposase RayT
MCGEVSRYQNRSKHMPQSLSHLYVHLVFSTKSHKRWIDDIIAPELYAYIAKVLFDECSSPAKIIGGIEDHIHILFNLSRTETLAHVVEMVKKRSSKWIKTKGDKYRDFQWQTGYGVFSVSQSAVPAVTKYIADQKKHHTKRNFKEEFLGMLNKHEIDYDEKYLWD